jgi:glutaredoxin
MKIKVFTTKTCPKCELLKKELALLDEEFETLDMSLPQNMTELRVNGCFAMSAPVLQVDDEFYNVLDLFDGDNLKDIKTLISKKGVDY